MTKEQAHKFIDDIFTDSTVAVMVMCDQDWCFKSATAYDGENGVLTYNMVSRTGPETWKEFLSQHDWKSPTTPIPEGLSKQERLDWINLQTRTM
jgi:hypothetical protein